MDFKPPLTGVLQSRTTSKNVKSIKSKQDTFQKKNWLGSASRLFFWIWRKIVKIIYHSYNLKTIDIGSVIETLQVIKLYII